jgi:hypothetical protein
MLPAGMFQQQMALLVQILPICADANVADDFAAHSVKCNGIPILVDNSTAG